MKTYIKIIVLILMTCTLLGCGKIEGKQKETDKEGKKVVAILKSMDSLHWKSVEDGMEKAALDLDIYLTVLWPKKEDDISVQNQLLEDAIKARPDAILIAPCDSEGIALYENRIRENGIELFFVDEEASIQNKDRYVGSDNYFAGKLAANALLEELPTKAKVAIVSGSLKQVAHYKRVHGFLDYLTAETELDYIKPEEVPDCTLVGGRDAMKKILDQNPDIKGVFCTSAMMVMGAMEECQDRSRNDVLLVGMDTQSDALQAIQEGSILAMVSQDGYQMGYRAVENALKTLNGERIPRVNYISNELITRENVGKFLLEYEEGK